MHTPSLGMYNCNQQIHIKHMINDCLSLQLSRHVLHLSTARQLLVLQTVFMWLTQQMVASDSQQHDAEESSPKYTIVGQLQTTMCSSIQAAYSQPSSQDL